MPNDNPTRHEFAKAFRFRVIIDGHLLAMYSAASVVLRAGKPDLMIIESPLEVHTVTPEHEHRVAGSSKPVVSDGKSFKVVYPKLARWYDGEPHDVCIEALGVREGVTADAEPDVLGSWRCPQAKPVKLAACAFDVQKNEATPETITFECETIFGPESKPGSE